MNWIQRFLTAITTHKTDVNAHHTPPGDGDLAPAAHESTHVAGGSDDIDSALALAAMADLTTGQIWQGVAGRPAEVAMPVGKSIATGSYTGNGADDRQITVGFKCSLVLIFATYAITKVILIPNYQISIEAALEVAGGTALHATDGFTVYQTADQMNDDFPVTYYYWAISE